MCRFILVVLFAQLAVLNMQRFATNVVPSTFSPIPPHLSMAELASLGFTVFLVDFIELEIVSHDSLPSPTMYQNVKNHVEAHSKAKTANKP